MIQFGWVLQELDACPDARQWVGNRTVAEASMACRRVDWAMWLLGRVLVDRTELIRMSLTMAREVVVDQDQRLSGTLDLISNCTVDGWTPIDAARARSVSGMFDQAGDRDFLACQMVRSLAMMSPDVKDHGERGGRGTAYAADAFAVYLIGCHQKRCWKWFNEAEVRDRIDWDDATVTVAMDRIRMTFPVDMVSGLASKAVGR